MSPNVEILTKRLKLAILTKQHSDVFTSHVSHSSSLHQWMDWCHPHFDHQESDEFIQANRLNWIKGLSYGFGVFSRQTEALLGMVAVTELHHISNSAALGYWIADKYQHNGYAKEALLGLSHFCFERLRLTRLEIICDSDNHASHKVAIACGAVEEGIGRNRFIYQGKPKNGLVYSLIP